MSKSENTKAIERKLLVCKIVSAIILLAPVITFILIALFSDGVSNIGKIMTLCLSAISLISIIVNIFLNKVNNTKKHLHYPIWFIMLALYIATSDWLFYVLIVECAITLIQDLVIIPIIGRLQDKLDKYEQADIVAERLLEL